MIKALYQVELPYSVVVRDEEFQILKKYFNVKYKEEKDFKHSLSTEEREKLTEDEKEKIIHKMYEEYSAQEKKELDIVDRKAVVDINLCLSECSFIPITVRKKVYIDVEVKTRVEDFTELAEKFERSIGKIPKNLFNNKCEVHIGGSLLMTVNDLKLLENSCTDVIQENLNHGWRIVACCVQPDGRRPDYILGRYNSERDVTKKMANR
jgi:hypothetical protein